MGTVDTITAKYYSIYMIHYYKILACRPNVIAAKYEYFNMKTTGKH